MKTFEFAERPILCGTTSELDEMIATCSAEKIATIIDLRSLVETPNEKAIEAPDTWNVRRLPVRGSTISEQDLDVFRREFFRHPKTIVVGPNAARSELMLLASLARAQDRAISDAEIDEVKDKHEERDLLAWLEQYLERHKSGTDSIEANT